MTRDEAERLLNTYDKAVDLWMRERVNGPKEAELEREAETARAAVIAAMTRTTVWRAARTANISTRALMPQPLPSAPTRGLSETK